MPAKRPPRDEYPDPNTADLAQAVRETAEADDGMHRVRGRYTAHWSYRDVHDQGLPPDVAKEKVIVVEECELDVIALVPMEHVDGFLAAIEGGGA